MKRHRPKHNYTFIVSGRLHALRKLYCPSALGSTCVDTVIMCCQYAEHRLTDLSRWTFQSVPGVDDTIWRKRDGEGWGEGEGGGGEGEGGEVREGQGIECM